MTDANIKTISYNLSRISFFLRETVRITLSIAEIRQKEAKKPPFTSVFIVKDGYYNQSIVKSLLQFTDKHDIVIIFIQ